VREAVEAQQRFLQHGFVVQQAEELLGVHLARQGP
jgi:hypothetical protein